MPPILITLPDKNGRQLILQLFGSQLYKVVGQWDKTKKVFYPFEKSMTVQDMKLWATYLENRVK